MLRSKLAVAGVATLTVLSLLALPLAASAQGATKMYDITVTNLTDKQVLSPPIFATHKPTIHMWQLGERASEELRQIAEEGKNAAMAVKFQNTSTNVQALPDSQHIMPGQSVVIHIKAADGDVLSGAMMLAQTNDGFTGLDNFALSGAASTQQANAYDAGTEENTEKASDVPGDPFKGMARAPTTPQQTITKHPGIAGNADLTPDFDWTDPVARITISPATMALMPESGGGIATPTVALYALLIGVALIPLGVAFRALVRARL
jgi:hypothetical protein